MVRMASTTETLVPAPPVVGCQLLAQACAAMKWKMAVDRGRGLYTLLDWPLSACPDTEDQALFDRVREDRRRGLACRPALGTAIEQVQRRQRRCACDVNGQVKVPSYGQAPSRRPFSRWRWRSRASELSGRRYRRRSAPNNRPQLHGPCEAPIVSRHAASTYSCSSPPS